MLNNEINTQAPEILYFYIIYRYTESTLFIYFKNNNKNIQKNFNDHHYYYRYEVIRLFVHIYRHT